jgi:DNA invertase Pin-like site-specific DNA recombinase
MIKTSFCNSMPSLQAAGCARMYTAKARGAQRARPQRHATLDSLRPDDTLVVWKLDRLARALRNPGGDGRRYRTVTRR